jgi:hypothetical protein
MTFTFFQILSPDDVDAFVTCEVPDKGTRPRLYELVTTLMVHLKCSIRCMKNGKCAKRYPQPFREETVFDNRRGFVEVKRARGGDSFKIGNDRYDVRSVVPHNPPLLERMGCHTNVLPFKDIRTVFYICKYITKPADKVKMETIERLYGHVVKVSKFAILNRVPVSSNIVSEPGQAHQGGPALYEPETRGCTQSARGRKRRRRPWRRRN